MISGNGFIQQAARVVSDAGGDHIKQSFGNRNAGETCNRVINSKNLKILDTV